MKNILLNLSPLILVVLFWLVTLKPWRSRSLRKSRHSDEGMRAGDLVPLAAWDVDETGYWSRLPWFMGILFGTFMATYELVSASHGSTDLLHAVLIGIFEGAFFGFAFSAWARHFSRSTIAAIYAANPPATDDAPRYRLVCTYRNTSKGTIGSLFLSRSAFTFVPYARDGKLRAAMEMGPVETLRVTLEDPYRGNLIQRFLTPRPHGEMEIRWSGGRARFIAPESSQTFSKIVDRLKDLRNIADPDQR